MAQYTIIETGTPSYPFALTDTVDIIRYQVREGVLYLDQEMTKLGFNEGGVENVDWGTIESYADSGGGIYRYGVRDTCFVLDCTINEDGFSGEENVSWENLETHKL